MTTSAESEARRALNRLRRSMEKGRRELDSLAGAIMSAEGEDFPAQSYEVAHEGLERMLEFVDEESRRLRDKVLQQGGLEPGRIRRG